MIKTDSYGNIKIQLLIGKFNKNQREIFEQELSSLRKAGKNIEVVSIVDRFLEHARIFSFSNGGHEEIYLSSADWMGRNLDKRLELLFPINQTKLTRRLKSILKTFFSDNTKAWKMASDGLCRPISSLIKANSVCG